MHIRFLKRKAKEINDFYERDEERFDFIAKSIVSELDEVIKEKDNSTVYDELGDLFAVCFILSDLIGGENFNVSYYANKSFRKILNRHKEVYKLVPIKQKEELYKIVKDMEEISRLLATKESKNEQR